MSVTLFPTVIADTLSKALGAGRALDTMRLGGLLSVILAARTVGLDAELESFDSRERLLSLQRRFSKGSGIDAAVGDLEEVKSDVRDALQIFADEYVHPALSRRRQLAAAGCPSLAGPAGGLTTVVDGGLSDDQLVREAAFYLDAGVDTSTQVLTSTLDYLLSWCEEASVGWDDLADDLGLIQRCVQEATRLKPTNPRIVRRALSDVMVEDVLVPEGTRIILDKYPAATATSRSMAMTPTSSIRTARCRPACRGRGSASVGAFIRASAAASRPARTGASWSKASSSTAWSASWFRRLRGCTP